MRDKVRAPFYGKSTRDGLHVLKDVWTHRAYLPEQTQAVLADLDAAIDATRSLAPHRSREQLSFGDDQIWRLSPDEMGASKRHPGLHRPSQERLLESALWQRFRLGGTRANCVLWNGLATVQYPLYDKRGRDGWGHIDLLAAVGGRPGVIELKGGHSEESPLRVVLEAVAYAVALRANWEGFAAHFVARLDQHGLKASADGSAPIPCIVLAPGEYWQRWSPTGTIGRRRPPAAWSSLRALFGALAQRGYPVRCGQVASHKVTGSTVFDVDSIDVSEVSFP